MTQHSLSADLCIVGGGLSGVCAALAAARNGASVILVQDRSVLGGNASSEVKMHVVGADCHGSRPGARETGILEELRLEDAYRNAGRCYSLWDVLLYEKIKRHPNITLLLESHCDGCTLQPAGAGKRIARAHVVRHLTEDSYDIAATYFADCSGDGRLGAEAGADFRMGREAQAEFGESLALPQADAHTLGDSILFTARRHETPQPFLAPDWVRPFRKGEFKLRPINGFDYGYWWAEWGGHLDTIKDNEAIRHELLRVALGVWDYVKNSGNHPDSAHWALEWVGSLPAKRESRRFLGDHVLCQGDIESGRIFEDQVAYGGWWLDLHPPTGIDAIEEPPCVQHHLKHLYSIPLRALHSRNVDNLFFAGRNISATHVAFASTRVMGTCSVMGQAIGTAAALFSRSGDGTRSIRELSTKGALAEIQQTLLRDDAFLLGIANAEQADLALAAHCAAQSAKPHAPAANVVNGVSREIHPDWNPAAPAACNYWESESLPAWLELRLPRPQPVSELHLTFCTGLQRELTLTASAKITAKTVRGAQPETVRDYDLHLDRVKVLSIRGNYLRKRVHRLPNPVSAQTIRLEVLATHGHAAARVFEARAYGPPSS